MGALNTGSTLGRYELLAQLGRGGMASVWVAREPGALDQRLIAVKAMLPELARHSDFRAMFLEEGQIIRSIDHPNVVKVHDVGEDGGILYMAMEWVEGDSLRAVIKEARRRRPIPAEIAVKIIADAAAGLHAAHELRGWDGELRNVVHCDVSPHNILVGIDGRAKVVDFGVANASLHQDLDGQEKVKGKFAYMSPEQAQGHKLDRRSDVFALGIVLYELTTGERLFRGETPAHTLQLVTSGPIPNPRATQPDYPERLAAITRRALDRDPARRYQTADALREALERYLVEERILVSHGSVAHLVRRVVGSRIEQLRDNVREALVERDGVLSSGLVPDAPALAGTFVGDQPSATTGRVSVFSGTPHPQSYESLPPSRRSAWPPLLAAIGGILAAAGSIVWVMNRPSAAPLVVTPMAAAARPGASSALAEADTEETSEGVEGVEGVDVDSIPLGAAPAASTDAGPPHAGPPHAGTSRRSSPQRRGARTPQREHVASKATPTPVATPSAPSTGSPLVEDVQLEEQVATPAPGPIQDGARGPFNRGAAMAQLGASAGRAPACKRPGGPTGGGRATVTFSPDGRATKVVVAAPFSGGPVGQCVSAAFSSARIPAFTGSPVALAWPFRIPE